MMVVFICVVRGGGMPASSVGSTTWIQRYNTEAHMHAEKGLEESLQSLRLAHNGGDYQQQ